MRPSVRFQFAGSDELAAQIRQGVKPDVSPRPTPSLPQQLARGGTRRQTGRVRREPPRLAVPADGEIVHALGDLQRPGRHDRDRLGERADRRLHARGARPARPARAERDPRERQIGGAGRRGDRRQAAQGAVDAGFVYVTDVSAARKRLQRDPAAQHGCTRTVTYEMAVVTGAPHPAAARRFVAGLLHGRGAAEPARRRLRPAGRDEAVERVRRPAGRALALALAFLTLPIVAIFADIRPGRLLDSLGDPTARDALRLSLETTTIAISLIVLVGTPAAYLLATRRSAGARSS